MPFLNLTPRVSIHRAKDVVILKLRWVKTEFSSVSLPNGLSEATSLLLMSALCRSTWHLECESNLRWRQ